MCSEKGSGAADSIHAPCEHDSLQPLAVAAWESLRGTTAVWLKLVISSAAGQPPAMLGPSAGTMSTSHYQLPILPVSCYTKWSLCATRQCCHLSQWTTCLHVVSSLAPSLPYRVSV